MWAHSVCRGAVKRILLAAWLCWLGASAFVAAQGPQAAKTYPAPAEVEQMLEREPITLETWPAWRKRLLDWLGDETQQTDAAHDAAETFIASQVTDADELPAPLDQDALAWYILARSSLPSGPGEGAVAAAQKSEQYLRKSLALDPAFARAHRNLAVALLIQVVPGQNADKAVEAAAELDRVRELDLELKVKSVPAAAALIRADFVRGEQLYQEALAESPDDEKLALGLTFCVISNRNRAGSMAPVIAPLVERHPQNGLLHCFYGLALGVDEKPKEAVRQFQLARAAGVEPREVLGDKLVSMIEDEAFPWWEQALWVAGGFVAVYACVIGGMALAGFVLGSWTRGANALKLLPQQPVAVVSGQVERTSGEPWLARWYAVALVLGLILFYVALPFLVAGLLGITIGLLLLILTLPRIPVKGVLLIVIVGFGMAWAVLKSMFARMGSGGFGVEKSARDCPRLFEALNDVAQRVGTSPVNTVFLSPGSDISVHQEGRGPWGMFGTKRRVLTLGLSTLRSLTVSELKSILAHEYAHFSHSDTAYSRFIYRVDLSIQTALQGMVNAGGRVNYVNPFFWFLVLYYRSYSLLSAGFSRSREYLADRMACILYGSDVFVSALTKVSTDGPLFESTMYQAVASLLAEQKAFNNMYDAFANFRKEDGSQEQLEQIRAQLDDESTSLFATHPTHKERLAAAGAFPAGAGHDETPAIQLFENPEEIEGELTNFLTAVIHHSQQQAQMAAQGT